ncbi:MAG: RNA polymerase sigma factor [Vulcanibacillus sp.]
MTDSQLIRQIKEGEIELYSELISRYEKKIIQFITNMLRSYHYEAYAEDICQETFYKAYRSLYTFRDQEATFSTWLYTIAKNTTLSEIRKLKYTEVPLEENISNIQLSSLLLPEQELLKNEKVNKVRDAINRLPEKQRSVIILREYDQLDYKEIAQILDSTVSSVKSLLFRARSGIKFQLESYIVENKLNDFEGMKG